MTKGLLGSTRAGNGNIDANGSRLLDSGYAGSSNDSISVCWSSMKSIVLKL
jgi:hypothetical protein